jgi:hypothetical protein
MPCVWTKRLHESALTVAFCWPASSDASFKNGPISIQSSLDRLPSPRSQRHAFPPLTVTKTKDAALFPTLYTSSMLLDFLYLGKPLRFPIAYIPAANGFAERSQFIYDVAYALPLSFRAPEDLAALCDAIWQAWIDHQDPAAAPVSTVSVCICASFCLSTFSRQ